MSRLSRLTENRNTTNHTPHSAPKHQLEHYVCQNHQDKPALFTLISEDIQEQLNYCEKCSILLASQGFNVAKIKKGPGSVRPSPIKSNRQLQVQHFLKDLSDHIEQIRERGLEVENALQQSDESYGRVMNEISEYFNQISTIVEIQKYLTYNSILTQRKIAQEDLRAKRESLILELQGLIGIGADIESNMQAVESVQNDVYGTIMQNYRTKLNLSYEMDCLQFDIQIHPFTVLAEIPKELNFLSDRIKIKMIEVQPTPSPKKRDLSGRQSANSSRVANKLEEMVRPANSVPSMSSLRGENKKYHQNANYYYFDKETTHLMGQRGLLPNQVAVRESLNLTQIRQNEQDLQMVRYTSIQETIPEEMQSSRESIEGYLAGEIGLRSKGDSQCRHEDTETLLIC